jgi:hypothetical protein
MRTPVRSLICGFAGLLLLGCGSDPGGSVDPSRDGTGGSKAPSPGSGSASGGAAATGGSGSGGTTAAGGTTGSGGSSSTGGAPGSGGASGGASGDGTGGAGNTPAVDASAADATTSPPADAPVAAGGQPYGCTGCTRLFNGVDLTGWDTAPGAWEVKPGGVLASKGIAADLYTHEDLGDYRIFFQVRHVGAMGGKDHKPCTVLFGKRPADPTKPARALGGAQFQPPLGGDWNYGVGGTFTQPNPRPMFDDTKWHQCEVLVKEAGSFHAACCPIGDAPCKTLDVLSWKGPGRKHPFDLMMHNGGLFDEYKEIWIERGATGDALLSQK